MKEFTKDIFKYPFSDACFKYSFNISPDKHKLSFLLTRMKTEKKIIFLKKLIIPYKVKVLSHNLITKYLGIDRHTRNVKIHISSNIF